ncbi:MAG: MBL fold metallo-hydrolase [Verrucomicrobiota bacterium]
MQVPIEDFFEDVIGKTMRGRGLNAAAVAEISGVNEAAVNDLTDGQFDEIALRAVAPVLELHPDALVSMGKKDWLPEEVSIDGLLLFNTAFGEMTVNAFLVWDPATKQAAVFDTGADGSAIVEEVERRELEVGAIYVTHTHADHVADLETLRKRFDRPPVFVNALEMIPGANLINEGDSASIGGLSLRTLQTSGHAIGGNTYVVEGLSQPLALVGDAVFCLSMGGGKISFDEALRNNREKIMTLPDETVICPGHGPMTTVGEEKAHNPFFPEFK